MALPRQKNVRIVLKDDADYIPLCWNRGVFEIHSEVVDMKGNLIGRIDENDTGDPGAESSNLNGGQPTREQDMKEKEKRNVTISKV